MLYWLGKSRPRLALYSESSVNPKRNDFSETGLNGIQRKKLTYQLPEEYFWLNLLTLWRWIFKSSSTKTKYFEENNVNFTCFTKSVNIFYRQVSLLCEIWEWLTHIFLNFIFESNLTSAVTGGAQRGSSFSIEIWNNDCFNCLWVIHMFYLVLPKIIGFW